MSFKSSILRILDIAWRSLAILLLICVIALCLSGVSPVYRFAAPEPFCGPDIFNPYESYQSSITDFPATSSDSLASPASPWKRANFHTHTRVDGIFNECDHSPQATLDSLLSFGYDIVTFSNHNKLTVHPSDSTLQVNVYEHGYNLFKYHKLVFGCEKVLHWDHLLPCFAFQRQAMLDWLSADADILQLNHPLRTGLTTRRIMERLSGYQLIELDSGRSTEQEYWDWALSAGHYSFGVANDDLHYPDRSSRIAVRCTFLQTPSARYEDLRQALLGGCFYSMRVPDYGHGDWRAKHEGNAALPYISDIGLRDNVIHIRLSQPADSIAVTGQDHNRLKVGRGCAELEYAMQPDDSYARFTAWFPDGAVIWSNPFARYDSSAATSPYHNAEHPVSILLTFIFNLCLILTALFAGMLIVWTAGGKRNRKYE